MEKLSSVYGWTPKQIREMDYTDVETYLKIIATRNYLEDLSVKKQKRNGR